MANTWKRLGCALLMTAISSVLVASCSGNPAKNGASDYINNLKLFNYPGCYQALSHQDQVDRTLDQFLSSIPLAPDVSKEWFKTLVQKTDYAVGDAKDQGEGKAVVTLTVTKIDLPVWERTVNTKVT